MKIGPHRNGQTIFVRPLAQIGPLLRTLLGQRDLHGIAACRLEGHQQALDPLGGEIITAGMGQHRQPARSVNRSDRVVHLGPLGRSIPLVAPAQVLLEYLLHVVGHPARHQHPGKVGPGHGRITGQLFGLFIGAGDEALLQTAPDLLRALFAAGLLAGQKVGQLRIFFIHSQRHDMDLVMLPAGGDLDPAHQSQRQLLGGDGAACLIKAGKGVVVSDC